MVRLSFIWAPSVCAVRLMNRQRFLVCPGTSHLAPR